MMAWCSATCCCQHPKRPKIAIPLCLLMWSPTNAILINTLCTLCPFLLGSTMNTRTGAYPSLITTAKKSGWSSTSVISALHAQPLGIAQFCPGENNPEVICPTCSVRPEPNYHTESKETVPAAILFYSTSWASPTGCQQGLQKHGAVWASLHSEEQWWLLCGTAADLISPFFQTFVCALMPPSCPSLTAVPACAFLLNAGSLLQSNAGCF